MQHIVDIIGGIVGYGADLYDCYSLIQVENAHEFIGAIAGNADGVLEGNYFVHDELAAINGISYAGKAEPISYEELSSVDGLPEILKTFRLTFVCDDKEIDVIPFKYGETIPGKQIPGKQTSGINVYIFKNGTWQKTEYTTKGSYLLFNMDGTDVTFIITSSENNTVIIILIILAALLGIIIFLWMRRRLS